MTQPPRDNTRGSLWLVADLSLNIWALAIVKANGLDYGAAQLVLIRAAMGFVLISPWIWAARGRFGAVADPGLHLLRVALSALTLTASFHAIARVPFALLTAVNFTRPVLTMVLAALILREVIPRRRWVAAGCALLGVIVAIGPLDGADTGALGILGLAVLAGCGAIIVTRRLRAAPTIVLMTFYTGGLALATAPVALAGWQPVAAADLPVLLAIGVFAQAAQICFLRAQFWGEAGVLSVVSYLSLVGTASVGYLVFDERLTWGFWAGAGLVILSVAAVSGRTASRPAPGPIR